jgi:hypothetical protein
MFALSTLPNLVALLYEFIALLTGGVLLAFSAPEAGLVVGLVLSAVAAAFALAPVAVEGVIGASGFCAPTKVLALLVLLASAGAAIG